MREIKFRAWLIKEKGYLQGFNLFQYHGYYNKGLKKSIHRYGNEWIEDEYILEQYTGLKDKNGKEIYEGDKVNIGEPGYSEPCEVVFNEGCFCIKAKWTDALIELNNYCNNVFEQCVEIIGNIHEAVETKGNL